MIQRTGEAVIRMPDSVQQAAIRPLVLQTIMPDKFISTNTASIAAWRRGVTRIYVGTRPSTIRRGNTPATKMAAASAESIQTPWKASGRCYVPGCARICGISQAKLPLYLSFFEFVHNIRKRGKSLLPLAVLVKKTPKPI